MNQPWIRSVQSYMEWSIHGALYDMDLCRSGDLSVDLPWINTQVPQFQLHWGLISSANQIFIVFLKIFTFIPNEFRVSANPLLAGNFHECGFFHGNTSWSQLTKTGIVGWLSDDNFRSQRGCTAILELQSSTSPLPPPATIHPETTWFPALVPENCSRLKALWADMLAFGCVIWLTFVPHGCLYGDVSHSVSCALCMKFALIPIHWGVRYRLTGRCYSGVALSSTCWFLFL